MPNRVALTHLRLDKFRNYQSLSLPLDGRHVVLTGPNGSGKTNCLEAVSYLSPGRGLRRALHAQVGYRKAESRDESAQYPWAVNVDLVGGNGPVRIGTGLQALAIGDDLQRRTRIDGQTASASEQLLEHSRIVWLTPSMDGMFTGPAADRRKFLDRLVLAIDPGHGTRVNAFEKSMRGRNRLLEEGSSDASYLSALETQMAETAIAIAAARAELVSMLRSPEHDREKDNEFPTAALSLDGELEQMVAEGNAGDLEDIYRSELCRDRSRDRAAGRTLSGPHRTNLLVRHQQKNMDAALCSTGEQKALLTGLVLAHARLVSQVSGMTPILLLDEIAAHLDPNRRRALFDRVDALGGQAWMTGTDASLFEAMGDRAQHFHVENALIVSLKRKKP